MQRALVPFALGALLLGCGCSEEGAAPTKPPDAASGAGGSGATGGWSWDGGGSGGNGATTAGGSGGNSQCNPLALPKEVPPGFIEYADYSCSCRFYYPGPEAAPLPPIEWEPCPQPGPDNPTCKRMRTPWTTSSAAVGAFPAFWFDKAKDKAYVQFTRLRIDSVANTVRHSILADVDGPVINAFVQPNAACVLSTTGVEGGRYLFPVGSETFETEGFIGGKLGEPPDFAYKQPLEPFKHSSWRMTSEWVIRWKSGLYGRRWGETDEVSVYDPGKDYPGYAPYDIRGIGPDVFFRVGGFNNPGIMSWNQTAGPRPLIFYPTDPDQAAINFGTDGTDMVWTHGKDAAPDPTDWMLNRSIMTAPFSTDSATVAKTARRLRSDLGQVPVLNGFAVGCGHAARQVYQTNADATLSSNLLIVRIADGTSWVVKSPPVSEGAQFLAALGITCDEVFTGAQFPDDSVTFVRIRLDSLGPGLAPD